MFGISNYKNCLIIKDERNSHMNTQYVFALRFLALAGFCLTSLFAHNSYAGGQVIAWGYNLHDQCDVPTEALSGVSAVACAQEYSDNYKQLLAIVEEMTILNMELLKRDASH